MARPWDWRSRGGGPLDIYEVLEDRDHPDFPDLGRLLWSLVATQQAWVYRRVETATLVGERRIRRHMSVDCRVPPSVVELAEEMRFDRFLVPLRFVMRQSLLSFNLSRDNLAVPLLTREQNIMATTALLDAAIEQCDIEVSEEARDLLNQVATVDFEAAPEALAALGLAGSDPAPTTLEEELLRWAVVTFDQNYLLLGDVALAGLRRRSIFKITQELPQLPLRSPARSRLPLGTEVAWDPTSFWFDTPDVTAAGSYHFQFIAPDGLTVDGGTLVAATGDGDDRGLTAFGTHTSRVSVLGLNAHAGDVPETDSHAAVVRVRPSPEGIMRASAASATITTVLLLLASVAAQRLDDEQVGPSTTLLLVIPGLVSTFLARPGEHSMVSRVLRGVRVLTLTSAFMAYLAAALLPLGLDRETMRAGWLVLGALSAVPAFMLLVAVRRCRSALWWDEGRSRTDRARHERARLRL